MPESLSLGPLLNGIGVVGVCVLLVWGFMTERIVPRSRVRRAEAEAAKWQAIALDLLKVQKTAIVPAAENLHALVSHLPHGDEAEGGEQVEGSTGGSAGRPT